MSKQLKVATPHASAIEKREKRIVSLVNSHQEGISPMLIFSILSKSDEPIPYNTIKSICIRLFKKGEIDKHPANKGLYIPVENPIHSIFEINLQNLVLTYQLKENESVETRVSNIKEELGTIKTRFEVGKDSKKATIHISTDYPFNISSLSLCVAIFKQRIKEYLHISSIEDKDIHVSSTEFNKDYYGCRIDGCNCITVESLLCSFKAYQKSKNRVRMEYKTKASFSIDFLNNLLIGNINNAENISMNREIIENQKRMERFLYNITSNQKIIFENQISLAKNNGAKITPLTKSPSVSLAEPIKPQSPIIEISDNEDIDSISNIQPEEQATENIYI